MDNNIITKAQFNGFKDLDWFSIAPKTSCIIGGAGGIGSWLAILLSRIGTQITIFDDDIIEERNIGGQLYPLSKVGKTKVFSLFEIIKEFSGISIKSFAQRITQENPGFNSDIVFAAFDNMKAREVLFENWAKNTSPTGIFIDGRLTAEQLQIYCVKYQDIERYRTEALFSDSDVPDAPCTMKQTSHVAAMIASYMVSIFTNYLANNVLGINAKSVPFYFECFIPTLTINTTD